MNFYLDFNDKRLPYVYDMLKIKKLNAFKFEFENTLNISKGDVVVLSPAFKWNEELANKLPSDTYIVCGKVSEEILNIFNNKKIKHLNLMSDEDFVLKNAILTAEGMLADLILNIDKSMFDANILVLGGGRVAKAVAVLFNKLGLNFDMSMRDNVKLLEAQLLCKNIINWKVFKDNLKKYDVVINTIPVKIFEKEDLTSFKQNSVLFELASVKCLQDESDNFKYILCPALPSKYTPQSAGKLIFDYLLNNFKGEI